MGEPRYTFDTEPLPAGHQVNLYKNGQRVKVRTFHWRRNAEAQCAKWRQLYGATPR